MLLRVSRPSIIFRQTALLFALRSCDEKCEICPGPNITKSFSLGMDFLKEFLCNHPDQAQIVLCDIDWPTYLKSSAYILHASPRLRPIKDESPSVEVGSHLASGLSLEELAARDPQHRKTIVEDFVRNLLSAWIEGGSVDLNLSLYKYGVDSIGAANMSLQIRNGIGALFEVKRGYCLFGVCCMYVQQADILGGSSLYSKMKFVAVKSFICPFFPFCQR